jgi:DTW domain-containing protein YfiP
MILASFPDTCRLVVGGIGPEYQESMAEMLDAIQNERNCLVLFPTDNGKTFCELDASHLEDNNYLQRSKSDERWDVIVIDGTWAQAGKLHKRYIPLEAGGGPPRVQLSKEAVALLAVSAASKEEASGHQLRRHPIIWKAVSTLEATRLLLGDMADSPLESQPWDALSTYQQIADAATRVQLGPHR